MSAALSAPPAEDEALEALERGDRKAALTVLMRDYGATLYRYCCKMVGNNDLAEEAHQMTFVQAYEGLARFAGRSSLRTWLFGIARHRCLDAAKIARRRSRRFELVDELPESPDEAEVAEDELAGRDLRQALGRCIDKLAPAVRTAVLLRYQQDISYPDMAQICKARPATLQARVARAMPVLRRCMENQGLRL